MKIEQIIFAQLCKIAEKARKRRTFWQAQERRQFEILKAKLERRVLPQNQPQPN